MSSLDFRRAVSYVTDSTGQRTGVLLDIATWDSLIDWIENATDTQIAINALKAMQTAGGPREAGWLDWEDAREEWSDEENPE